METPEVVFASNRGPLSFRRDGTGYVPAPGVGAVAELLDVVGQSLGSRLVWIASAVSEEDHEAVRAGAFEPAATRLPYHAVYLSFPPEVFRSYYEETSNRILWFACHDLWEELGVASPGADWRRSWAGYGAANRTFAQAIARRAGRDCLVLFHDYHLLLSPRALRRIRPELTSGLFIHGAWSRHGFASLPRPLVSAVLDGMLGADVVGFHTDRWGAEFLDTCEELGEAVDRDLRAVARAGQRTWVRSYPVPIDAAKVAARGRGAQADRWLAQLDAVPGILIARADRVEPSKNALRGFQAFELLLQRRRELVGGMTFVASLLPRRADMAEYARYRKEVERAVQRINDRFPGSVRLFLGDDRMRSFAAMRRCDVLLVNSIRDGMNLVAKEGAILNERHGVLVMSSTVGAAAELGRAALVIQDPRNVEETADVLGRAVTMPPRERARRGRMLREVVTRRTPAQWLRDQLNDLQLIRSGGAPE